MSETKIYPKGIRCFPKHEKQPEFVLGAMVISVNEFQKFINENQNLLTDYNGESQLKLQILNGSKGIYLTVDTYKKSGSVTPPTSKGDGLPF